MSVIPIRSEASSRGARMLRTALGEKIAGWLEDGRQTLVEFPADIAQGEMPPFFVIGEGGVAALVNYRVAGRYLIVDRLFEKAELRLGAGRRQQRVTIANRARSGS